MAALYLGYMGLLLLACTALHGAIIFAWNHIKWTSARPLPAFLQFPAAELLLLNLLALPAAMYAMLLMVQAPTVAQRVMGAAVCLLVLAHLWLVSSLLLFIVRNKTALGLCTTESDTGDKGISGSGSVSRKLGWTGLLAVARFATIRHRHAARYPSLPQSEYTSGSSSLQDSAMGLLGPETSTGIHPAAHAGSAQHESNDPPDLVVIADEPSGELLSSMRSSSSGDSGGTGRWWGQGSMQHMSSSWRTVRGFSRSSSRAGDLLRSSRSSASSHWQLADVQGAGQGAGELIIVHFARLAMYSHCVAVVDLVLTDISCTVCC